MKHIDGEQYSVIKNMIAAGSAIGDIAKVVGFSTATVYSIKNSVNYVEYKAKIRPNRTNKKGKLEGTQNKLTGAEASFHMLQLLKEQNRLLELLSNKVAYIVEALV